MLNVFGMFQDIFSATVLGGMRFKIMMEKYIIKIIYELDSFIVHKVKRVNNFYLNIAIVICKKIQNNRTIRDLVSFLATALVSVSWGLTRDLWIGS